tara:strand:+ start:4301 stop:4570 length:270 start_codon:yes stop_codon:yes gene_type:complete
MAKEQIYILGHGDQETGFTFVEEGGNRTLPTHYAWEDGAWVEIPKDEEYSTGITAILESTDPCYAFLLIPHTSLTFDSDNKITNVQLPG